MNNGLALNPNTIKNSLENYTKKRTDDELNLIEYVRNILISVGLTNKLTKYDTHKFIIEARDKTTDVQRFYLNRYWAEQLIQCKADTSDQRNYLLPNGEIEDWIKLFNERVIPCILENNLPI